MPLPDRAGRAACVWLDDPTHTCIHLAGRRKGDTHLSFEFTKLARGEEPRTPTRLDGGRPTAAEIVCCYNFLVAFVADWSDYVLSRCCDETEGKNGNVVVDTADRIRHGIGHRGVARPDLWWIDILPNRTVRVLILRQTEGRTMNTNTMREIPLGRNGNYGALAVDCSRFIDVVHEHVYTYGLRQILNDAIADKKDDEGAWLPTAALVAKAQRRLDTLYSGELRVRGEAAEPIDPVDAEVYRMAKAKLTELARATPEYAETKGQKDRGLATINLRRIRRGEVEWIWVDAVADYEAKVPAVRKAAQRIVKERAAAGEVEI